MGGGLGGIWDVMGGDDLCYVLGELPLAGNARTRWTGGRGRTLGGGAAPLDARVHVGLVVKAHEKELVTSLDGTRKRLETDIVGGTVAREGHESDIVLYLSFALQDTVCGLHAGYRGCGVLEGAVDPWHVPGIVGIAGGGDLEASCGVGHDHRLVGPEQDLLGYDGLGAARAQAVTFSELHRNVRHLLYRYHCLTPR